MSTEISLGCQERQSVPSYDTSCSSTTVAKPAPYALLEGFIAEPIIGRALGRPVGNARNESSMLPDQARDFDLAQAVVKFVF